MKVPTQIILIFMFPGSISTKISCSIGISAGNSNQTRFCLWSGVDNILHLRLVLGSSPGWGQCRNFSNFSEKLPCTSGIATLYMYVTRNITNIHLWQLNNNKNAF